MGTLLQVQELTTKVSGYTILNNLNFSIDENELRVLLGPNGAGKTTLIAMITGQFKPSSGRILFAGQDITGWAPDEIFQCGISRKFQVPNMYETLSVFDNVMVSLQSDRRVFKYLAQPAHAARIATASGRSSSSSSSPTRPMTLPIRCLTANGSG